jgi:hypothetical protein
VVVAYTDECECCYFAGITVLLHRDHK